MSEQRKKKGKLNKRKVVATVVLQGLIVIVFANILYSTAPTPIEKTKATSIVVKDIVLVGGNSPHLVISTGSGTYYIDNSVTRRQYSVYQREDMISVGDRISIRYERRFTIQLGAHNNIVDARADGQAYRLLDVVNESRASARKDAYKLAGFIEFVFLFVVFFMVISKSFYRK